MRPRDDRSARAARRLVFAIPVGAVVCAVALVARATWPVAATAAWASVALVLISWVWLAVGRMDSAATAAHAQVEDFSRTTSDLIMLAASVVSLVAVGFTLVEAGNGHGAKKALLILLAILAVGLSWLLVHAVFALRYGALYYDPPIGGVDFNDPDPPDYRDFIYLALTIGMTFQVSDTDLTAKQIRRVATRHALLSYLFGAVIVALAINTVASLLR